MHYLQLSCGKLFAKWLFTLICAYAPVMCIACLGLKIKADGFKSTKPQLWGRD